MANFGAGYFNALNVAVNKMGVPYIAQFSTVQQNIMGQLQTLSPNFSISGITLSNGIAIATSLMPNIFQAGQVTTISGADQDAYNGTFLIFFTPDPYTFWFRVSGSPDSPATGTITATYSAKFNGIIQNRRKKEIELTADFSPIKQIIHLQTSYHFDEFSTSPDQNIKVRILISYLGKPYQIMNKKLVANSVYEYNLELYNGTP